jgi:hypothetical protein
MSNSRKRSRQIHSDDDDIDEQAKLPRMPTRRSGRATRNRSIPSYAESNSDPESEKEFGTGNSKSTYTFTHI